MIVYGKTGAIFADFSAKLYYCRDTLLYPKDYLQRTEDHL